MSNTSSNQMWGGRFASGPDAIMEAINASIGFDQRLATQDIAGSRAHAAMLAAQSIISDSDFEAIEDASFRGKLEAQNLKAGARLIIERHGITDVDAFLAAIQAREAAS